MDPEHHVETELDISYVDNFKGYHEGPIHLMAKSNNPTWNFHELLQQENERLKALEAKAAQYYWVTAAGGGYIWENDRENTRETQTTECYITKTKT